MERRRRVHNSRRALSDPHGREIMELGLRSSQGAKWSRNMALVTSSPAIPPCPGLEARCRREVALWASSVMILVCQLGFHAERLHNTINDNCSNALVHPMLVPRAWEICHYITQITSPFNYFFDMRSPSEAPGRSWDIRSQVRRCVRQNNRVHKSDRSIKHPRQPLHNIKCRDTLR